MVDPDGARVGLGPVVCTVAVEMAITSPCRCGHPGGAGAWVPPPGETPATVVLAVCAQILLLSTMVFHYYYEKEAAMTMTLGAILRQAREVRGRSSIETARSAGISPAYLSKLENDAVRRPSPAVLHRLSEVLGVPYAELMALVGYPVPGVEASPDHARLGAALFVDLTDEERDELLEYLAWYRARKRSRSRSERLELGRVTTP